MITSSLIKATLRCSTTTPQFTQSLSTSLMTHSSSNSTQNSFSSSSQPSIVSAAVFDSVPSEILHRGPLHAYDYLVDAGAIRADDWQRSTVGLLQERFSAVMEFANNTSACTGAREAAAAAAAPFLTAETHRKEGGTSLSAPPAPVYDIPSVDDFTTPTGPVPAAGAMVRFTDGGNSGLGEWLSGAMNSMSSLFGANNSKPIPLQAPDEALRVLPPGMYLYGSVGTGKTFLMDLLHASLPGDQVDKRRTHFHSFMLNVHARIHAWRQVYPSSDPIPPVAASIVNESWFLAFDEFQVSDIVDAMILKRLFSAMVDLGAVVVTTSNRVPDDLYKNGLQRHLFTPFIDFIHERWLVSSLDSGIDYRRTGTAGSTPTYHVGNALETMPAANSAFLAAVRADGCKEEDVHSLSLSVLGHDLVVPKTAGRVAQFTFEDLCKASLGAVDYISICKKFHTLIVTGIPALTIAKRNEARRLITLIDEAYQNKVRLIVTAEVVPQALFQGDSGKGDAASADRLLMDDLKLGEKDAKASIFTAEDEVFAFQRCVSRLVEMQSMEYASSAGVNRKHS